MILCNGSCAANATPQEPGCELVPLFPILKPFDPTRCGGGCGGS
jgi:hypothetical protein